MAGILSGVKNWLSGGDLDGSPEVAGRPAAPRPVSAIRRPRGETGQIHTVDAVSYADAPQIAALYRDNISVIVNMAEMTEPEARRLLDFMLGLKEALLGDLQRVTPKVYLLAPNSVTTNNDEETFEAASDGLIINPAR
ncbi:MAG: cell division protein SepF [Actinomycetales bacterium]|nr:cell division protein SepF [Actinomycetales bacterium]